MPEAGPQIAAPDAAAPPPSRRLRVVLGALAAAAASAGLAWWFSGADRGDLTDAPPAAVAAAPQPQAPPASASADAAQVHRAFEDVQSIYAETGADGLRRFADGCAEALPKDRRVLDYCLALDLYAAALAPEGAWARDGDARRLAIARAALPAGADAEGRLVELDRLARQASGVADVRPVATTPAEAPAVRPAPAERKAAVARKVQLAVARTAPPVRRKPAADRCRLESTPAARLVCASPELKAADRRMQRAYVDALAAGADPAVLDRDQADWRRARSEAGTADDLARIYALRIGDLEQAARTVQQPAN